MAQLWQLTREMFGGFMGQSDEEANCRCDWADDNEDIEMDESSGLGTVIVIYMVLAGLFIGAYWIPSLTQGSRSQRREQQQQQHQLQQQQQIQQQQQQQQQQQDRRIELRKKGMLSMSRNNNTMIAETLDNWQDVLLPQGEEVYWLIQAQQHNLWLLNNDQQQLRQLQQQLMLTLSLQDVFHDLPTDLDTDNTDTDDHFRDFPDASQIDLSLASTTASTTTTTAAASPSTTTTTAMMINN